MIPVSSHETLEVRHGVYDARGKQTGWEGAVPKARKNLMDATL